MICRHITWLGMMLIAFGGGSGCGDQAAVPAASAAEESAQEKSNDQPSDEPVSPDLKRVIVEHCLSEIERASAAIDTHPDSVDLYSRRGDNYFYLARFREALADYTKMVELDPAQDASHWRRGIAFFYAGDFEQAAAQFNRYHAFDNVDRENGIWRYLSQYKAQGKEQARQELLKYEKDDREPFGAVYRLFAGELTGDDILAQIAAGSQDEDDLAKQLFYAHLYIGLNELVEGRRESAVEHLAKAAANDWAPQAGYGPRYMWHVGRLQYELLQGEQAKPVPAP